MIVVVMMGGLFGVLVRVRADGVLVTLKMTSGDLGR